MISERLSRNLQKENFNGAKSRYEEKIRKCGYKLQLSHIPLRQSNNQNKNLGIETSCDSTLHSFPMFQPMCEEYFWN